MRYHILILILCWGYTLPALSQDTLNNEKAEYRFTLGVQLGTDIGGAVPFPVRYAPSTINPYPRLTPSLGAKLTFPVKPDWTIGAELTYKRIGIDSDARVKKQRFKNDDENIITYFTGSAKMKMEFTMLEMPIYAKYTFRNKKDRILAGPYFAWVLNAEFTTHARKGFIIDMDGNYSAPIPPEGKDMNFSNSLGSWDLGIFLGYERELMPRVELGLRFSMGFKDIFKPNDKYFQYHMLHMRGSVVLSYNLFDLKPPKWPYRKQTPRP